MLALHVRNLPLCFIRIIIDRYFSIGLLIRMFNISFPNVITLHPAFHLSALWFLLITLLRLLLLVFLIVHIAVFKS